MSIGNFPGKYLYYFDVSLYSDKKKSGRYIRVHRQISNGEGRKRHDGETYADRRAGDAAGVSDCAPPLTPPTTRFERVRARTRRTTCVPQGPVPT